MSVIQSKGKSSPQKGRKTAKKAEPAAKPGTKKAKTEKAQPAPKPKKPVPPPKPKFVPSKEMRTLVEFAAGLNMTQDQIRLLITNPHTGKPISRDILIDRFKEELAIGKAKLEAKLAGNLLTIASSPSNKGSTTANIFLLKSKFGWREPEPVASEKRRVAAEMQAQAQVGEIPVTFTLKLEEDREPEPPADGAGAA